ncbi:MAG: UDP-glucose 4-epimerase [bacterium]|nr:UDP-glucose 4-epimerase [bacterium]
MRVVVTGATGFIGRQVVRRLARAGDEVHAVVRRGRERPPLPDGARIVDIDDLSTDDARSRIADVGADSCIHCAWLTTPGEYLTSPLNASLQSATIALAERLAASGCRKFVGVGTCFEYDVSAGALSERTALSPAHAYSAAKAATYRALMALGETSSMRIAWARLFYLYGPGEERRRLVPSVVRSLLRGEEARCTAGAQVRDFLHVEDAAAALCAIARADVVDAINVASGEPVTVAAIVQRIAAIVGCPERVRLGALPYAVGDPMFVLGDNGRLRATGWTPRWSLEDGLADTVRWWREHGAEA